MIKKIKHRVSRATALIKDIREKKLLLAEQLREHQDLMRPGWYRLERSIGYSLKEKPPAALKNSKRFVMSRKTYPISARAIRLIEIIMPPILVQVPHKKINLNKTASQIMRSSEGD